MPRLPAKKREAEKISTILPNGSRVASVNDVPSQSSWDEHSISLLSSMVGDKSKRRHTLEKAIENLIRKREEFRKEKKTGAGATTEAIDFYGRVLELNNSWKENALLVAKAITNTTEIKTKSIFTPKNPIISSFNRKENKKLVNNMVSNYNSNKNEKKNSGSSPKVMKRGRGRPPKRRVIEKNSSNNTDVYNEYIEKKDEYIIRIDINNRLINEENMKKENRYKNNSNPIHHKYIKSAIKSSPLNNNSNCFILGKYRDVCDVCKLPGELLCCSTCQLVFHVACTRPKIRVIPPDSWSCAHCDATGITGFKRDSRQRRRAMAAVREMAKMQIDIACGKSISPATGTTLDEYFKKCSNKNNVKCVDKVREIGNALVCYVCMKFCQEENKIRCSTCDKIFHPRCVRPIMSSISTETLIWSCAYCVSFGVTGVKHEARGRRSTESAIREMDRMKSIFEEEQKIEFKKTMKDEVNKSEDKDVDHNIKNDNEEKCAVSCNNRHGLRSRLNHREYALGLPKSPHSKDVGKFSAVFNSQNLLDGQLKEILDNFSPLDDSQPGEKRSRKQTLLYNPQNSVATEWKYLNSIKNSVTDSFTNINIRKDSFSFDKKKNNRNSDCDNTAEIERYKLTNNINLEDDYEVKIKREKEILGHEGTNFSMKISQTVVDTEIPGMLFTTRAKSLTKEYVSPGIIDKLLYKFKTSKFKNRQGSYHCKFCMDDETISICCFCACRVCFNKHDTESTVLCDMCDAEYHQRCLDPPLTTIPNGDWFCPSCSEAIIKAMGQKQLKENDISNHTKKEKTNKTKHHMHRGPWGRFAPIPVYQSTAISQNRVSEEHLIEIMASLPLDKSTISESREISPMIILGKSKDLKSLNVNTNIMTQYLIGESDNSYSGTFNKESLPLANPLITSSKTICEISKSKHPISVRSPSHVNGTSIICHDDTLVNCVGNLPIISQSQILCSLPFHRSRSGRMVKRNAIYDEVEGSGKQLKVVMKLCPDTTATSSVSLIEQISTKPNSSKKSSFGRFFSQTIKEIDEDIRHLITSKEITSREGGNLIDDGKDAYLSKKYSSAPTKKIIQQVSENVQSSDTNIMSNTTFFHSNNVPSNLLLKKEASQDSGIQYNTHNISSRSTSTVSMKLLCSTPIIITRPVSSLCSEGSYNSSQNNKSDSITKAAYTTNINTQVPVKVPRRKPGARECMQISRRFGANIIPQNYMDILLDYCTRGKVEHLIRMRERLDDHSRFLELQLASLESLVKRREESENSSSS